MLKDASPLATVATIAPPQPKFATIKVWCALSGMSQSQVYKCLALGQLIAIKLPGTTRTLIDVERGLAWLRSAPPLQLGVAKQETAPSASEAPRRMVRSSPD